MTTQPQTQPGTTGLTVWGSRDEVRELKARLGQMALMLPGGARLDANAITALAQASIAHGLDPFNGEIWIIPNSGVMIGIKGLRKKAREQVQGNFWVDFRKITSPEERAELGIPNGALAYEAHLFDTENINTYTQTVERMLKAGLPWEAVVNLLGSKPYTTGIGFATPAERSKMELAQRAMKRAEADALKRRFDVPFGLSVEVDGEAPEFAGEWVENEPAARPEPTPEERSANEQAKTTLYGEPDEPPSAPVEPEPQAPAMPQTGIWQTWRTLTAEAEALGLTVPAMDPAADDADVAKAAGNLRKQINAARKAAKA